VERAAELVGRSGKITTRKEWRLQKELARMMADPAGKTFAARIADQCFRSAEGARVVDQMQFLLSRYGIPSFLSFGKRAEFFLFRLVGGLLPSFFGPLAKKMLRREMASVILPGEAEALARHIRKRIGEGVRVNLNHLGEAILGEGEAERRLRTYLEDLAKPEVDYISVKISTICSQLNLLAWEETLAILADRLRALYRADPAKFVNLDMEEYRDLHLTVELFRKVLEEPEFHSTSAGIVLQSYLPESFPIQKELTEWAVRRVKRGGAPVKIRIVKGANLAMEQVEASIGSWPQAPYTSKEEADACFKKMVEYALRPEHAQAVHVGIASHNMFDVAYALLLREEREVGPYVNFEMLEGMADPMRRALQEAAGNVLLYCPSATEREFVSAVAYLLRRLDENTAPQNFLRAAFDLVPGSASWRQQERLFRKAFEASPSFEPRRRQDRRELPDHPEPDAPFQNEPDTDWSLPQNRLFAEKIVAEWREKECRVGEGSGKGRDPSRPGRALYRYPLSDEKEADRVLERAAAAKKEWGKKSVRERSLLLAKAARGMRERRGDLIGAMIADGGKMIPEADAEVSEAIDFAEYYRRSAEELERLEGICWSPKGVVLVAPPWNFPCAIPAGGALAALAAGNCVILKPAQDALLVGWLLANIFWEAGIPREALQFFSCKGSTVGGYLARDSRVDSMILTGSTETAKKLLKARPGLDLHAESGGKNSIIVTAMADRDLAVKDVVQSAFGHSGQKCSACSLAICEAEVYDDPHFREQLRDAAASLAVGSAWDLKTKVGPLISPPEGKLLRGLTTLEEGEEWLLKPEQDPGNPHLWSPGIKMGVRPGGYTHRTEFFGPLLGLMRAEGLEEAVAIANGTPYGLTAGLHSLDLRENRYWEAHVEAGNCYLNRGITGAVVQRQPFGGCKASSFGKGIKAGGPNYLTQLMRPGQKTLPKEGDPVPPEVQKLGGKNLSEEEKKIWSASLCSYAFYWNRYFSKGHDPSLLLGQDNILRYLPRKGMLFRIQEGDSPLDAQRVAAAAAICRCDLEVSRFSEESEERLIARIKRGGFSRIRLLRPPSQALSEALAEAAVSVILGEVVANGRLELLHYLREVAVSDNYHRYGNLGRRENEKRNFSP